MANWQKFEINCTDYLNEKYGSSAKFVHHGGSDSNVPDIMVDAKNESIFGIEAKKCPAQCGQFVLLPNVSTREFEYSTRNFSQFTKNTFDIITHMNKSFDEYKEAGTAGKEIIFDGCKEVFANWVIEYYNNKMVKYFITNDYTILPIQKFAKYFDITATYRIKRSGSSSVGKTALDSISNHINQNFEVVSIAKDGTKLFVTAKQSMHDTRFVYGKYEYMFSARDDKYEIRKLSNTFNANVIFSINLISHQSQEDLQSFENALR